MTVVVELGTVVGGVAIGIATARVVLAGILALAFTRR